MQLGLNNYLVKNQMICKLNQVTVYFQEKTQKISSSLLNI